MKKVLTYEFQMPEQQQEFEDHLKGEKALTVLVELDSYLRSALKYETLSRAKAKIFKEIREELYKLYAEEGLKIGD